jgi:hypothetical protein
MIIRPIKVVRNSSHVPNLMAICARGGAMNNRAIDPTIPPKKALKVVIPIALKPFPCTVIGYPSRVMNRESEVPGVFINTAVIFPP